MHPSDVVRKYLRPGDVLSQRYRIEGFIGSGAYGSIFSAIDEVSMERVAVKALPPPSEGVNEVAIGRFHREMKVVSSLRHPNVITMYDYGETSDRIVYMVLEFVDGPTLYDLVAERKFAAAEALDVTRQIASGLKAAHDQGVVHRDLKPQNIMLMAQRAGGYQVKVLDFGMAKLLQRINDESIIQLTREGVAVGTPRYIAPEQARGKTVGPYSDIYALGLLMYEMFTGERAVKADSIETAIIAHVSREPLNLPEIDDVPSNVRPILFKMIEKSVKKRYQGAEQLIADVDELERAIRRKAAGVPIPAAPKLGAKDAEDSAQRIKSIHSAENLVLDYDRFDKYAPEKKKRGWSGFSGRRTRDEVPLLRIPSSRMEWFETVLVLVVAPIAFVLLTAQFHESNLALRFLVGLVPTMVAALASLLAQTPDWRWSFFRLWLIAGMVTVLGSHLFMVNLAMGLLKNPAWFLDPLAWFPGVRQLDALIAAIARAHVATLMELSTDVALAVRIAY